VISWQEAGDEPFLMARRLAGRAAIVVGESRYLAGLMAQRANLGNLFILDDGFQHLQLHRDFDLVTIDPQEWLAGEALLPLGRWREPKEAIGRAQAVCIQGGAKLQLDIPVPQFPFRLEVDRSTVDTLQGKSITAFAGIAKPDRFFSTLESHGLSIHRRIPFPDHHNYADADIEKLNDEVLLTTEKDAVKLEGRGHFVAFRVSANIADFGRLQQLILQRVEQSGRGGTNRD
jgi:tetraacyldisaccharide 4'-kinase